MRVIYIPDIAWSVYWQEGDTDMYYSFNYMNPSCIPIFANHFELCCGTCEPTYI